MLVMMIVLLVLLFVLGEVKVVVGVGGVFCVNVGCVKFVSVMLVSRWEVDVMMMFVSKVCVCGFVKVGVCEVS